MSRLGKNFFHNVTTNPVLSRQSLLSQRWSSPGGSLRVVRTGKEGRKGKGRLIPEYLTCKKKSPTGKILIKQ